MKYLRSVLLKFQALSLRERLLAVAAAVVVLSVLLDLSLLGPQRNKNKGLQQQIAQQKTQFDAMAKVLAQPAGSPIPDGSVAEQAERDDLRRRLAQAELLLGPALTEARLGEVLRKLIAARPDLTLVSLKTLAPEEIYKSPTASAAAPGSATAAPATKQRQSLYKHGVEVVVRGEYLSLMPYLQRLQANPNRLFWAKVKLDVQTYPQATLMLTIYTVSDRAESPLG